MNREEEPIVRQKLANTPEIKIFGKTIPLPRSKSARVTIGVALCIMGVFGFLPVLGFWMIPLGMLILSYEFAVVRRLRRRIIVWWERRQRRRQAS